VQVYAWRGWDKRHHSPTVFNDEYADICIMRLAPSLVWRLEGEADEVLDARLMPLLRAIAASASLAAAVAECGISYRAAWGLLRDYRRKLGEPLVLLERGRGASLTPAGERLIGVETAATRRLARILPGLAAELGSASREDERAARQRLRVAASHDLVLAALATALPKGAGLSLELAFMGSLHALKAFAEGRADVAGFHVPIAGRPVWDRAPMLRELRARRDRLIRFVDRDQGLILPRGNPMHVKSFRDIASRRLRFINRQPGSGTRMLIDQVIAYEEVDPSGLIGYANEEFTHRAVAATVASGGADAGFGLRAAAAEHRLAFIPQVRERYFLAVRAKALETVAVGRLLQALRSPMFARVARDFAGYGLGAAGSVVGLDAIGAAERA
jgi:molybdate transport repressor ModE-like protein